MRWHLMLRINLKYFFNISLLFFFLTCFSQDNFQSEPKEFKKIHFVFEGKSNYFINDNGVYADTLLISFDFPNLKYSKVNSPIEANGVCGFLPFTAFSNISDKKKLVGGLYHSNQTYECTYYVNKNKTKIKIIRDNNEVREKVKKYFNEYFQRFTMDKTIDYKKETENTITTTSQGTDRFEPKYKVTYFDNERLTGSYKSKNSYYEMTSIVVFNKKLNPKIVPGILFHNVEFGAEKITTLFSTYELKSVTYE